MTEANHVRPHSLKDRRQALVVELEHKGVDHALGDIDVVVAEPVEVLVSTERVGRDAIDLMVHLTVRLRGRGAGQQDDVPVADEVTDSLSSLTSLREGPKTVGLVQDDEVPVNLRQLMHALVVDGEEFVREAQLLGVLSDTTQRLLLG